MEPERIDNVLDKLLHRLGIDKKVKEYQSLRVWNKVVGEKIIEHTNPIDIQNGRLIVEVDSPQWMQELSLLKPDIILRLNREIGESIIKELFFVVKK